MVGKDAPLGDIDDESLERVRLLAEKKRQLEETADQVRQEISSCFERLAEALRGQERLLLRQVEAVHRQQLALAQQSGGPPADCCLGIELADETELIGRLREFGRLRLANGIAVKDSEPYRAEEYQEAGEDCVSFDKSLKSEADEFDVSSVMRRKRDARGNVGKPVLINFSCTSCEPLGTDKPESTAAAVASTSKQLEGSPDAGAGCSSGLDKSPFVEVETDSEESSAEDEPTGENSAPSSRRASEGDKVVEAAGEESSPEEEEEEEEREGSSSVPEAGAVGLNKSKEGLADEHPVQIQQWLRQILAETETEPIVHEIGRPIVGQFAGKMPNAARLYSEFPVET